MSQSEIKQPQKERLPHSIWGILSFWLALSSFVVYCAITGVFMYLNLTSPEPVIPSEIWDKNVFLQWVGVGYSLALFAAFILGIVGVCQPRTRKVFAYWGLFLSVLPFALLVMVFAVILFLLLV